MKILIVATLSLLVISCSKNETSISEKDSSVIKREELSIVIKNPASEGSQEDSNEVIDMGVLDKVGDKKAKRVYLKNSTGGNLLLDFSDIIGTGLSISLNNCGSSIKAGSFCYLDLDYTLLSSSQAGLSNVIASIVTNPPAEAGPEWGILSIIGNVASEINDGVVELNDVSVSSSALSFGNLKDGEKRNKRLYISNSSVSDIDDLSILISSPFNIIKNNCNGKVKAKRICSIDIEYSFNSGESVSQNLSISFDGNKNLPIIPVSGTSSLVNNSPQFSSSYGLKEHDTDLENDNDPEIDLSNIKIGDKKIVRLYFHNENASYDFSGREPVAVGDATIKRNTCSGIVKKGVYCYIDVEYTRNEIPAEETNVIVANELDGNIKFDFSLPVGVFDESYFGSAVFE